MPGNVSFHQLLIGGVPMVFVRLIGLPVLDMPEHMWMFTWSWITLIVKTWPITMIVTAKTLRKFSEDRVIFISSDTLIIVKTCGRFFFWSRVIFLNTSFFSSGSSPFWKLPDGAGSSSFEELPCCCSGRKDSSVWISILTISGGGTLGSLGWTWSLSTSMSFWQLSLEPWVWQCI